MTHWLHTFLAEKRLNTETVFKFEVNGLFHSIPFEVVEEFIVNAEEDLQQQIKEKLILIDFHDGNLMLFFRYLAEGIAQTTFETR